METQSYTSDKNNRRAIILCGTGQLIAVSFGGGFIMFSEKNTHECILGGSLIFVYLFCMLLWSNPVRYGIIHRIDGVVAKAAILYFITYTLACKKMEGAARFSYYMIMTGIGSNAYLSNFYSEKEWCSRPHIYYHGLMHFFCFVGSLYAFLMPTDDILSNNRYPI